MPPDTRLGRLGQNRQYAETKTIAFGTAGSAGAQVDTGDAETMGFRIAATGLNARIPQHVAGLLDGNSESGTVDAHAIQPFYTGLLARACGMSVGLAPEGEAVVVATRQAA